MEHEAFLADGDHVSEQGLRVDESTVSDDGSRGNNVKFHLLQLFTLKFCVQFNTALLELPLLHLFEQTICQAESVVPKSDISESLCKGHVVQDRLARLTGFKVAFDALPCMLPPRLLPISLIEPSLTVCLGLLTALFYGHVANVYGRRPVMMISIVGQMLALLWIMMVCKNSTVPFSP